MGEYGGAHQKSFPLASGGLGAKPPYKPNRKGEKTFGVSLGGLPSVFSLGIMAVHLRKSLFFGICFTYRSSGPLFVDRYSK